MTNIKPEEDGVSSNWLIGLWAESLASVLEVMTGERPNIVPGSPADPGDNVLWWEQQLDLADGSRVWVGAERSVWVEMGRRSLEIAGVEDGSEEDFRGTYQELLQQTLSAFSQSIGDKIGREVNCLDGRVVDGEQAPESTPFTVQYPGGEAGCIFFAFTGDLGEENAPGGQQALSAAPEADSGPDARSLAPLPPTKTAELLLDVELPVSVSFGRAHLPLRDVLKLASGSIVELNRTVAEPVEVIINNCVIARGEVVVVDGNYGVRISEIISREQRLRTLN